MKRRYCDGCSCEGGGGGRRCLGGAGGGRGDPLGAHLTIATTPQPPHTSSRTSSTRSIGGAPDDCNCGREEDQHVQHGHRQTLRPRGGAEMSSGSSMRRPIGAWPDPLALARARLGVGVAACHCDPPPCRDSRVDAFPPSPRSAS